MRVSTIQVTAIDDAAQLQARVESETDPESDDWFEPFDLWFRFPGWCRPYLSADCGDPFLAALLVPAMRRSERLSVPAPVSPRLREALPDIQDIYATFDHRNTRIPVETPEQIGVSPPTVEETGVGLFFSMGVDSFYSLLKNMRDHPAGEKTVTHLISVHGFDVPYETWDSRFPPDLLENFRRVATETGKTLIPVVTNVRQTCGQLAPWTMMHGGGMASIALALGGLLRRVLFAASTTYDHLDPWGTHPVLDPLWSSETLTVVHDGCEMETIGKTGFIARSDLVMQTLRPCPGYGLGYNCGRCLKCLRTIIDLRLAGALDRCQTLPHEIDPEWLRAALVHGGAGALHVLNYRRRLEGVAALGAYPEVREVLAEHLKIADQALPAPHRGHRRFFSRLLRRFNA